MILKSSEVKVHKCNRLLIDSNNKGILSIALLELFRITRITLHCPFHESSLPNRHWMGCRRYSAANRLEVHLDEDDSRSSSQAREHGKFSACFTTACGNPDTLKSMSISSRWVNKPVDCPLTGLAVLVWSASTFSSSSSSLSTTSTDTATQLWMGGGPSTGLPVLEFVRSQPNKTSFPIS